MNREQQEMALWRRVFERWYARDYDVDTCDGIADAAVAEFRKRYPVEQAAPEAVWYDEPPFPKDGKSYPCWIAGEHHACAVHWSGDAVSSEWVYSTTEDYIFVPLHRRRVCPIAKPPEPTT